MDNLFLESTYPMFYDTDWNELSRNQYTAYQYKTDLGNSMSPLGAKYHEISGFEDDTGVYITFDLTNGSYSDFSVLGVIHNGENPMESLHINAPNPERFTITLSDNTIEYFLGNSSGYTYYTLVAINTSYTTPITYDITVN